MRYPVGKLYEDIPVAYEVTKRAHKAAHIANRDYYYFQRGSTHPEYGLQPQKAGQRAALPCADGKCEA